MIHVVEEPLYYVGDFTEGIVAGFGVSWVAVCLLVIELEYC